MRDMWGWNHWRGATLDTNAAPKLLFFGKSWFAYCFLIANVETGMIVFIHSKCVTKRPAYDFILHWLSLQNALSAAVTAFAISTTVKSKLWSVACHLLKNTFSWMNRKAAACCGHAGASPAIYSHPSNLPVTQREHRLPHLVLLYDSGSLHSVKTWPCLFIASKRRDSPGGESARY